MEANLISRTEQIQRTFLESALATEGAESSRSVLEWLAARRAANEFEVKRVPLDDLMGWYFEEGTGDLVHRSGKFFRIEGMEVKTNFGPTARWMQPIINQPEIGILGFLTKRLSGILHFLVQAKMEPGNVNLVQLSPTVQATRSNFTQVHGGTRPRYLEYFVDRTHARVLTDQLQSEQGSRFLRKRNRNIIIEVQENEPLQVHEDFCWLTLGQISKLLRHDNIVNMDSRTVLSSIRYGCDLASWPANSSSSMSEFSEKILISATAGEDRAVYNFDAIVSWITQLKIDYQLETRRVPLREVEGWRREKMAIRHETGRFFSVVGVAVTASNREVGSWCQPLIESAKGGILCLVVQERNGILHFLVQGRVEPGNFDAVELAPTLQCTPTNYDGKRADFLPPFYDLVVEAESYQIRYDSIQSEEGGRFYHDQNRYLVVEIEPHVDIHEPPNYIWMTLRQIKEFIRLNNYFNIEARGLVACLPIGSG